MNIARAISVTGAMLIGIVAGCDAERSKPANADAKASEASWSEQLAEVQAGTRTEVRVLHSVITDADFMRLTAGCESLEVLNIETLQVNSAEFAVLAKLPHLRQLRLGSPVGDAELHEIASITSLRVLNLPNGEFTDVAIKELARLPQLELLRFRSPHVTDRGLETIAMFPALRFLHLIEVPITDEGLRHLEGCEQLESLYLDGCGCTDDGILRLLKALPTLHLHRDQLHLDEDSHAHPH